MAASSDQVVVPAIHLGMDENNYLHVWIKNSQASHYCLNVRENEDGGERQWEWLEGPRIEKWIWMYVWAALERWESLYGEVSV